MVRCGKFSQIAILNTDDVRWYFEVRKMVRCGNLTILDVDDYKE